MTLERVVGTEMDKTIAHMQTQSVPGVFSVTNRSRVENEQSATLARPDHLN